MAKDDRDMFEVFDQVIALLTENRDNLLEVQALLLKHGEASAQVLSSATEKMFLGLSTKGRKRHLKSRSKASEDKTLYCSFCGKSQHEVKKLVAGPTVFICDECAELCVDIVRSKAEPVDAGQDGNGDTDGS